MDAKKNKKVALALSGGVDSAAVGMILKKQGYDLAGLYLKLHPKDTGENRARLVAEYLNIPFYIIDAAHKFKESIIDYFLKEYKEGRTPNPCVKCNRDIKFGILYNKAMEMGFEKLATGHYISKKQKNKKTRKQKVIEYYLYIANDKNKDQSYFLYNLNQEILAHTLFPLGDYKKAQVKEMARKWKLPVSEKESQDICFLNRGLYVDDNADYTRKVDHNEFLKKHLKMKSGDIFTVSGEKIGKHQGLPLYTIGQRRSVGIGGTGPYYVVKKDIKKNILIVSEDRDDKMLYSDKLEVCDTNWVRGEEPKFPLKIKARIRYRHEAQEAEIKKIKIKKQKSKIWSSEYFIKFKEPQRAVTAGQSAAFYKGDELLGGGIIL